MYSLKKSRFRDTLFLSVGKMMEDDMAVSYKKLFHLLIEKKYDECTVATGGWLLRKYHHTAET